MTRRTPCCGVVPGMWLLGLPVLRRWWRLNRLGAWITDNLHPPLRYWNRTPSSESHKTADEDAKGTNQDRSSSAQARRSLNKNDLSQNGSVADAMGEVEKLEAAIEALGADSVHAQCLQEVLSIARNMSRLPTASERVESCKKFLDHAKQRVAGPGRDRQGHRPESGARGRGCRGEEGAT